MKEFDDGLLALDARREGKEESESDKDSQKEEEDEES